MIELQRFADTAALDAALAEALVQSLREGIYQRGRASLVLSGGRTPRGLFARLAAALLAWDCVTITLADDRWVPEDHPDSNARSVREALLRGNAAQARFVPLYRDTAAPWSALADSSAALATLPRPFDAVVLGMGEDGHTASLFPGQPLDTEAWVVPVLGAPKPPPERVSLGLRALRSARRLLVLATGTDKRVALERWRAGEELPIARVCRGLSVSVLLDRAADPSP